MDNNRFVTVTGDAAKGLLFDRMQGQESLGRLFEFELELLSEDDSIDLSSVVGRQLTVRITLPSGDFRHFDGIVAQFTFLGMSGRYARYQSVLRPRWWLLTQSAGSRIFQRKTVPAIVEEIFRDRGMTDFEDKLVATYRTWEYLVQYRESDWNFISRILEQEGIYYYFVHADGAHKLVLADSFEAHQEFEGYETISYATEDDQALFGDHVHRWSAARQLVSGTFAAKDFNFEVPKLQSLNRVSSPTGTANDDLEVYRYPGVFRDNGEGSDQVRVRLQEIQSVSEVFEGSGDTRGIGSGFKFTLKEHPRSDQNAQYLVVNAWYDMAVSGYETGVTDPRYRCAFTAIPGGTQFRAPASTPKPRVEGPQTAIVVGPEGEEIWTDNYGRVKLQFHWDRDGQADENSSCWVRVSQIWAGANWGAMHVPRIGQEVVVDFLEGDPDRPIVVGRVYNADNMPPYELPEKGTQSGIKSRSSKGGVPHNSNEIRFEDLKGHEEMYIQAERNQATLVKANQTISVGANRAVSIGANETIFVGATRTTTVAAAETQTFNDVREMSVGKTETVTVEDKHTGTYNGGREITVNSADEVLTVDGVNMVTTVHGQYNVTADEHLWITQNSDSLLMKDKFELESAGHIRLKNNNCEVKLEDGTLTLQADSEIRILCGKASVTLKKDGTIEIAGETKVSLTGGQGGGQGSVALSSSGAAVSGPKVTVSGSASAEITGAIVKINS